MVHMYCKSYLQSPANLSFKSAGQNCAFRGRPYESANRKRKNAISHTLYWVASENTQTPKFQIFPGRMGIPIPDEMGCGKKNRKGPFLFFFGKPIQKPIWLLLISIDVGPFDAWLTLNMNFISLLYMIIYNLSLEINICRIIFIISLNMFVTIL